MINITQSRNSKKTSLRLPLPALSDVLRDRQKRGRGDGTRGIPATADRAKRNCLINQKGSAAWRCKLSLEKRARLPG